MVADRMLRSSRQRADEGLRHKVSRAGALGMALSIAFGTIVPAWANGITERVSLGPGGAQGDAESITAAISADGRFVAFGSLRQQPGRRATRTAPYDVFVRDRQTGTTERVSVGRPASRATGPAVARLDLGGRALRRLRLGRHQPGAGRHQRHDDVFVRDRQTGTTERVSLASSGAQGNGGSVPPRSRPTGASSPSPRRPATWSPGDTNGTMRTTSSSATGRRARPSG